MTPKQAQFVREYLVDFNATQAAVRAGYSSKTANRIASENLSKPVIAAAIQRAIEARAKKADLSAQDVVNGLLAETKGKNAGVRVRAWELLGKHLGMFVDRVQHEGGIDMEIVYDVAVTDDDSGDQAKDPAPNNPAP